MNMKKLIENQIRKNIFDEENICETKEERDVPPGKMHMNSAHDKADEHALAVHHFAKKGDYEATQAHRQAHDYILDRIVNHDHYSSPYMKSAAIQKISAKAHKDHPVK